MSSTISAKDRIRAALEHIEDAQRLLDKAAQELSPIMGMAAEWSLACRHEEKVKDLWVVVRDRLNDNDYYLEDENVLRSAGFYKHAM